MLTIPHGIRTGRNGTLGVCIRSFTRGPVNRRNAAQIEAMKERAKEEQMKKQEGERSDEIPTIRLHSATIRHWPTAEEARARLVSRTFFRRTPNNMDDEKRRTQPDDTIETESETPRVSYSSLWRERGPPIISKDLFTKLKPAIPIHFDTTRDNEENPLVHQQARDSAPEQVRRERDAALVPPRTAAAAAASTSSASATAASPFTPKTDSARTRDFTLGPTREDPDCVVQKGVSEEKVGDEKPHAAKGVTEQTSFTEPSSTHKTNAARQRLAKLLKLRKKSGEGLASEKAETSKKMNLPPPHTDEVEPSAVKSEVRASPGVWNGVCAVSRSVLNSVSPFHADSPLSVPTAQPPATTHTPTPSDPIAPMCSHSQTHVAETNNHPESMSSERATAAAPASTPVSVQEVEQRSPLPSAEVENHLGAKLFDTSILFPPDSTASVPSSSKDASLHRKLTTSDFLDQLRPTKRSSQAPLDELAAKTKTNNQKAWENHLLAMLRSNERNVPEPAAAMTQQSNVSNVDEPIESFWESDLDFNSERVTLPPTEESKQTESNGVIESRPSAERSTEQTICLGSDPSEAQGSHQVIDQAENLESTTAKPVNSVSDSSVSPPSTLATATSLPLPISPSPSLPPEPATSALSSLLNKFDPYRYRLGGAWCSPFGKGKLLAEQPKMESWMEETLWPLMTEVMQLHFRNAVTQGDRMQIETFIKCTESLTGLAYIALARPNACSEESLTYARAAAELLLVVQQSASSGYVKLPSNFTNRLIAAVNAAGSVELMKSTLSGSQQPLQHLLDPRTIDSLKLSLAGLTPLVDAAQPVQSQLLLFHAAASVYAQLCWSLEEVKQTVEADRAFQVAEELASFSLAQPVNAAVFKSSGSQRTIVPPSPLSTTWSLNRWNELTHTPSSSHCFNGHSGHHPARSRCYRKGMMWLLGTSIAAVCMLKMLYSRWDPERMELENARRKHQKNDQTETVTVRPGRTDALISDDERSQLLSALSSDLPLLRARALALEESIASSEQELANASTSLPPSDLRALQFKPILSLMKLADLNLTLARLLLECPYGWPVSDSARRAVILDLLSQSGSLADRIFTLWTDVSRPNNFFGGKIGKEIAQIRNRMERSDNMETEAGR